MNTNLVKNDQNPFSHPLVRFDTVSEAIGLNRHQIHGAIRSGKFPKPVKIGKRAVAWVLSEVQEWIAARIAERDVAGVAGIPQSRRSGRA